YSGSGYISCPFGGYSGHTGADYACAEGTPVKAADAGTVVSAGWDGGYGNCVKISHGNGIVTIYAHCSALLVSTGEKVYKGQLISRVGHTGHVIGNPGDHLHFEIRVNSVAVNPFRFVTP
ncbi:MAG TPA: M23 family metallopeptidase, partial [Clostridia bacterium]|nr:M23 family metallopeptidase [Clostridia bacterium]